MPPKAAAKKSAGSPKKAKVPRAPSAYNLYMKSEIAKVKKASPSLSHKDAFAKAATNWKTASANPKNKK